MRLVLRLGFQKELGILPMGRELTSVRPGKSKFNHRLPFPRVAFLTRSVLEILTSFI